MRFFRVAALASLSVVLPGCPEPDEKSDGPCDPGRVRYAGYATDETCITLVDAENAGAITQGGASAPVLLAPTNGGVVAASSSAITITWDTPLDLDVIDARAPAQCSPKPSALASLARSLWPVSTAHAHEAPITGAVHRLRLLGVGGSDEPIDVVTSKLTYTLDDELEAAVLATTGPITIELVSMYVTNNLILNAANDGPFAMTPSATITVE